MHIINIFIPILSVFCNIFAQVFFYKYLLKKRLLKSEYAGFVFGLAILIISALFVYGRSWPGWLPFICADSVIYLCLSYCYFHFINMGETARRIRLLRELDDAPEGLTREQILLRYDSKEMVLKRIDRLVNNNQLVLRNARYFIGSPAALIMSKALFLMKQIVMGRRSEEAGI